MIAKKLDNNIERTEIVAKNISENINKPCFHR